jgi:alginate O-acetyltransferase complex protein AlgI
MVFTSHIFLFYFLPAVLLVYYLLPDDTRARNAWLLVTSILFYAWAAPRHLILLLIVAVSSHVAANILSLPAAGRRLRFAVLSLSVGCNLGLLVYFKHWAFIQDSINGLLAFLGRGEWFDVVKLVLPIGISFYVFQAISYTVDVYRGVARKARSITDFACYLAMFPQLVAGPIVTFNSVADALSVRQHSTSMFAKGAALFILGFAKKMLLANPVAEMADLAFAAQHLDCATAWAGVGAYALQIYFDFSGYSDMAIGLGRMFGFEFARNFDRPYFSASIGEFWRRWHITLGVFLRDYLYIPLGGNRKGTLRTLFNLFFAMFLGGLWHGANWTFVTWGLLHGLALASERVAAGLPWIPTLPRPPWLPEIARHSRWSPSGKTPRKP